MKLFILIIEKYVKFAQLSFKVLGSTFFGLQIILNCNFTKVNIKKINYLRTSSNAFC